MGNPRPPTVKSLGKMHCKLAYSFLILYTVRNIKSSPVFIAVLDILSLICNLNLMALKLADRCVKNLKSFGFVPPKGTNKIQISTLSKEKIKKLANLRVIQKTLVYVIGIAPEIATEDILKSPEYFGQYGDLTKVVVNTNNVYNATRGGPSYSAYLTYSHPRESAIAILVFFLF